MSKIRRIFGVFVGAFFALHVFCVHAEDVNNFTPKFTATTTALSANTSFSFSLSAAGTFYVDWGDGNVQEITRASAESELTAYSHTYTAAGTYDIKFGGTATGYATTTVAAISFSGNTNIAKITGSLGAIFSTISNNEGDQPRFSETFANCTNITSTIPENLFSGVTGAPVQSMFGSTFLNASKITGSIPAGLFSGLSGAPAENVFGRTFQGMTGITGSIPENLFSGLSGAPATKMFYQTFVNCTGLTGSIPAGLFAGVRGAPAESMFCRTFYGCSGLTGSIPENLFAGISGAPADYMFFVTFYGCSGLTGSIPENLFAGVTGAPAYTMFYGTFKGCSGLTGAIPGGLFAGISGAPAGYMFYQTFYNCSGLTGFVPSDIFANITSGSATSPMTDIFAGTGLLTSCPNGATQYTTGYESSFSSKVACTCNSGYFKYAGTCHQPCDGVTAIEFDDGTSFAMVKQRSSVISAPALQIRINGAACYIYTELGDGTLDVVRNNTTYHAVNVSADTSD